MDKATRLNRLSANRELFKRVVSQVGEFRMLELMGKDHQTGPRTHMCSIAWYTPLSQTTPSLTSDGSFPNTQII
jgi:hypothetical protein